MKRSKLVLLPGLDGTGMLFAPLRQALPKDVPAEAVAYPESLARLDDYVEFAAAAVHGVTDVVLIAESFSGPIAISLLRNPPTNLRAIVLVATFTTAPRALLRHLSALIPSALIRAFVSPALTWFCANEKTSPEVIRLACEAVGRVPVKVLRSRVRLLGELPADLRAVTNDATVPILILEPTRDRLVPINGFVSSENPNVLSREIAGPHFLLQTCPRECWEEIERFLLTCSFSLEFPASTS